MSTRRSTLATVAMLATLAGPTGAADHPTIHHAGVVRAVDASAGYLVLDEGPRLGPTTRTTIRFTATTIVVRLVRDAAGVAGRPIALTALQVGDYVVVRGFDPSGEHVAEVVWSFGPAG